MPRSTSGILVNIPKLVVTLPSSSCLGFFCSSLYFSAIRYSSSCGSMGPFLEASSLTCPPLRFASSVSMNAIL